jgi:hypothetical protein
VTDRVTAFHEAGHAVAATVFGLDLRLVTVHQPGTRADDTAGSCELSSKLTELDRDPHRVLTYILAGAAAERRLTGRTSPRDAKDRAGAATVASFILEIEDEQHPSVRGLVAAAEAQAVALMYCDETVWRAVERVAKDLQRKGRLTGRDVQLCLREARR